MEITSATIVCKQSNNLCISLFEKYGSGWRSKSCTIRHGMNLLSWYDRGGCRQVVGGRICCLIHPVAEQICWMSQTWSESWYYSIKLLGQNNSADNWMIPQYSPPISMSRVQYTTFSIKICWWKGICLVGWVVTLFLVPLVCIMGVGSFVVIWCIWSTEIGKNKGCRENLWKGISARSHAEIILMHLKFTAVIRKCIKIINSTVIKLVTSSDEGCGKNLKGFNYSYT